MLADHEYVVRGALRAHANFGDGAALAVGEVYPVWRPRGTLPRRAARFLDARHLEYASI